MGAAALRDRGAASGRTAGRRAGHYGARSLRGDWDVDSLFADINYELGNYAASERLALLATTNMQRSELSNPKHGAIRLTLIAAAAQQRNLATAKATLADLQSDVPSLTSLAATREWISPQADLQGYEPLFQGLRLSGL